MVKNLHKCEPCNLVYTNKKELVKHKSEAHPAKKEKKTIKSHNLVSCHIEGCNWKNKTGGFSYHMKVHHERKLYF